MEKVAEPSPSTNQTVARMPSERDEGSVVPSVASPAPQAPARPSPPSSAESAPCDAAATILSTKSSSSSNSTDSQPEVVLALNSSMRRGHYTPSVALPLSHNNNNSAVVKRVRPSLRFDRHFLADPNNRLKLIQLSTGVFALLMTENCYPNEFAPYCTGQLFSFFQLFIIVCVHGFFVVATAMLALCSLLGFHDTFYEYNFPLLEKLYTALAVVLYSLGSTIAFFNMFSSSFSVIWPFQVLATFVTGATYAYDFWKRVNGDASSKHPLSGK